LLPRDAQVTVGPPPVWDVTLRCKGHPAQSEVHVRRVDSGSMGSAARKARYLFRVEHRYKGNVEILDVTPARYDVIPYESQRRRR
jgi:hypothetical protein